MRKFIGILIGLFICSGSVLAASSSERMKILKVDNENRNLVVEDSSGTTWLIHSKGCWASFIEGGRANISMTNELDGYKDIIKINAYQSCSIDQAEEINSYFKIQSNNYARTEVIIEGEDGKRFRVQHGEGCTAASGFTHDTLYVRQYGKTIQKNDKLFVPKNYGSCYATYVTEIIPEDKEEEINGKDKTAPSNVGWAKAVPRKNGALVYWALAKDNVAIDHYIIGWQKDEIHNIKNWSTDEDMDNQVTSKQRNVEIENLESDEDYYFYVIAVDTSGNRSSNWSTGAHARTKSSIQEDEEAPYKIPEIEIQKTLEKDKWILFEWNFINGTRYYVVTVESEEGRVFALSDYRRNQIYIMKHDQLKGKDLTLVIKSSDFRDQKREASLKFRYE